MFGFLRVPQKGLDSSEQDLYKSHFCAVCHALDAETGKLSSLLTNYDITFWTVLAASLTPQVGACDQRRCTAVPWRQVAVQSLSPEVRRVLTAVTHHLIGSKLDDDRQDGDRRVLGFAMKALRQPTEKARAALHALGLPTSALDALFCAQAEAEKSSQADLDSLAAPTRAAMAEVFGYIPALGQRGELEAPLHAVGHHLGALLYWLDAVTDYDKDVKRRRFNALHRVFGAAWSRPAMRSRLMNELSSLEAALVELPIDEARGALCANLLTQLEAQIRTALPANGVVPVRRGFWSRLRPAAKRPSRKVAQGGFVRVQDDCCIDPSCCDGCSSGCDCGSACNSCDTPTCECCCDASSCACDINQCCCGYEFNCCCCSTPSSTPPPAEPIRPGAPPPEPSPARKKWIIRRREKPDAPVPPGGAQPEPT